MKNIVILFLLLISSMAHAASIEWSTTSSNIGLGTILPAAKLDVIGTIKATQGQFGTGNAVVSGNANGNIGLGTVTASNKISIGSTGQNNFDSNGNLGLGTVNPPNKLYVVGTIEGSGLKLNTGAVSGYVLQTNSVGVGTWVSAASIGAGGGASFWTAGNVGINTTSNVGIGSTNPGAALDVQGSMRVTNAGSPFTITSANIGVGTTGPLGLLTVIGGNVGIGTNVPGVALDVTGSIRASSGTAGQSACWKADKTLGQCTSVVDAGGACTCS